MTCSGCFIFRLCSVQLDSTHREESSILLNVEDVAVAPGECLLLRVAFS